MANRKIHIQPRNSNQGKPRLVDHNSERPKVKIQTSHQEKGKSQKFDRMKLFWQEMTPVWRWLLAGTGLMLFIVVLLVIFWPETPCRATGDYIYTNREKAKYNTCYGKIYF